MSKLIEGMDAVEDGVVDELRHTPDHIPKGKFTQVTPAMPEHCKVAGDSIKSYRNYYNGAKTNMFNWKNRETPAWIR